MRSDQLYIYQEELHCSVGLGVDAHSEPVAVSRLVEEDQVRLSLQFYLGPQRQCDLQSGSSQQPPCTSSRPASSA